MITPSKRQLTATFNRAVARHQAGQLADAEILYRTVLGSHPKHAPSLHHLGVLAHQAGQHEAALALIVRALEIAPAYVEAHCNLGLVLLAMQQAERAIEAFQAAILLKPDYAEAHYNLGFAFAAVDRNAEALGCYDAALRLLPGYVDARCNRAMALHALGRPREAVEAYRDVMTAAPHLTRLHTYSGVALLEQGRNQDAIDAFRLGLTHAPDDPATHFCLSEGRARIGDLDGAICGLQEALRRMISAGALATPNVPPPRGNASVGLFPDALRAVMRCMAAAGIEVFLICGTLLGAIRDGDFIDFDKDIDVGVSSRVPLADLHRALACDPDFEAGAIPSEGSTIYCTGWRGKLFIDFFRCHEEADHVWYQICINGQLLRWLHAPFKLRDLKWHGITVHIPQNPEVFLEETYGRGWRTPDPDFAQWACPNLAGGFSLSCRYMAHFDIFIALWRGHRARALNQCREALALAPGDAFFLELMGAFAATQENGIRKNWPATSVNAAVEHFAKLSDLETNAPDRERRG